MADELHPDSSSEPIGTAPVVLMAWAPWCGPCQRMTPQVTAAAQAFDGRVALRMLRVDEEPDRTAELGIRATPTLIALCDERVVGRLTGAQSVDAITSLFEAAADPAGRRPPSTRPPRSLTQLRAGVGLALVSAGLATGRAVLVVIGIALTVWAASPFLRLPTGRPR